MSSRKYLCFLSLVVFVTLGLGCEKKPTLFTDGEKSQIIELLNSERSSLKASDTWNVVWDDELAERGQAHSEKCYFEHELMTRCDGSTVGQNLFATTSDDVTSAHKGWWNEIRFYDHATDKCTTGTCGHFRQLAYSGTRKVGCGKKLCSTINYVRVVDGKRIVTPYSNEYLITCNYEGPMAYEGDGIYNVISSTQPKCSQCKMPGDTNMGVTCSATQNLCTGTHDCSSNGCSDNLCNMHSDVCGKHGTVKPSNGCKCDCKKDYKGERCDQNCGNIAGDAYCDALKGFMCFDPEFVGDCAKACGKLPAGC